MQAHASIIVGVPCETVFAFIADPANDRSWRSHVLASHGVVKAVGDRMTQTYSYEGRMQTVELEVSEYDPPTHLAYRLAAPVRARLAFQCHPELDGTRVSVAVSATPAGPARLFESRITSEAVKLARADLERLKRVLESRR